MFPDFNGYTSGKDRNRKVVNIVQELIQLLTEYFSHFPLKN